MTDIRFKKYQLRVNNPDAITDIDVLDSVQSQYSSSPHMLALLVNQAALADPGKDLMLWYANIFNPRTAQGIGLDIWGRIVGVPRVIDVEEKDWFGFEQALLLPFGDGKPTKPVNENSGGIFWNGERAYHTYDLDDEAYRALIFWKAFANIASAEAPMLNLLLQKLFPGYRCCVIETGPMHIRVVTRVGLSAVHEAIFRKYGLMAKGAGIGVSWLDVPEGTFGFTGWDSQKEENVDTGFLPFFWEGADGNANPTGGEFGTFFSGAIIDYQQT